MPCLALYGPNATGKSGLVDALEFHLSESGTLERLGAKTLNNFAGPSALKHNLADERGVPCEVAMTFRVGATPSSGARSGEGKRPISATAEAVRKTFAVDPIIRGYALRGHCQTKILYCSWGLWRRHAFVDFAEKNARDPRQGEA